MKWNGGRMICWEWETTRGSFYTVRREYIRGRAPASRRLGLGFDDSIKRVYSLGLQRYKNYTVIFVPPKASREVFPLFHMYILPWEVVKSQDLDSQGQRTNGHSQEA
jgi:hypothetical protein